MESFSKEAAFMTLETFNYIFNFCTLYLLATKWL